MVRRGGKGSVKCRLCRIKISRSVAIRNRRGTSYRCVPCHKQKLEKELKDIQKDWSYNLFGE